MPQMTLKNGLWQFEKLLPAVDTCSIFCSSVGISGVHTGAGKGKM